jgi:hypothetical protein
MPVKTKENTESLCKRFRGMEIQYQALTFVAALAAN